jgi:hypothetical protein
MRVRRSPAPGGSFSDVSTRAGRLTSLLLAEQTESVRAHHAKQPR